MDKLVINGGKPLKGEVTISGAKNAVVAIIPAVLLVKGKCRIENVPDISDVDSILKMIAYLGAKVDKPDCNTVEIDCTNLNTHIVDKELAAKMRASYYLMGALAGRFRKAAVPLPGGCNFGLRPIDQHLKGFNSLGCITECDDVYVNIDAGNLRGGNVFFDVVSVGATINVMLAAVLAPGKTVMENAAKEPHVVDLANFLNSMGANIKGAGTDIIKIEGVSSLSGGTYSIIPDQIEAGTYMSAVLATGGDAIIKNVIPKHLDAITAKFMEMGAVVEEFDDSVRVAVEAPLKPINVKTLPYPGFPTDLQPQIVVLLTTVSGQSTVTEGVWDSRFQYIAELTKLGADIDVQGKRAVVNGGALLSPGEVEATDLRAGASMVIAGLLAKGTTKISQLRHIDRGYEHIVDKLRGLGADIERIDE
ncbi:MAG: UDP-N-acetylglucosamine 1-carboxyvinyltransferase [Clostridia bacterium]|nr:UDP-N-acetylglucosamine 1-carboxyvinyltransferase [Clostridia bacterium]